jgi:hypothetical protein
MARKEVMKNALRWLLGLVALAIVGVLLVWAFLAGRAEIEKESEQERPVKVPPRVSSTATGAIVVKMDRATQERIALKMDTLQSTAEPREAVAYGKALDPASLATLASELSAAEASLRASRAEAERLQGLNRDEKSVALRALETAGAQFAVDQSRVRSARERIALTWGAKLSDLDVQALEDFVRQLVKLETIVAEVNLPIGVVLSAPPTSAHVSVVGQEDQIVSADAVWMAPSVGPLAQGQGFLLRVATPPANVRPGVFIIAHLHLPGEAQQGVVVPRSALVRLNGAAWAYVQLGDEEFTRREVKPDHPTDRGWFSSAGWKDGERVVVTGAQLLLSEELKSEIQVGEEEAKE